MRLNKPCLTACCIFALLTSPVNAAEQKAPNEQRPSPEVMKAIQECAAKQGVEMQTPPEHGQKPGQPQSIAEGQDKGDRPPPLPSGDDKKGPPKMTDAQKAVIDACFKEQGVTPPKAPPHGGRDGKRPEKPAAETTE